MDNTSLFLLNIFLNSLLAFFTAALLIEALIFLFRIKQGRIASFLRMIPIIKLPLDLFRYDFSRWSYLQGINPLDCAEGTRSLSVWIGSMGSSGVQFFVEEMTFTLADLIGYLTPSTHLKIFSVIFSLLCMAFFVRNLKLYYRSKKILRKAADNATSKKINGFTLLISKSLHGSPFVAGLFSPTIFMPSYLAEHLSKQEYEAVLAHEMEHIRKKDLFVRFIVDLIASIFWWIPTKWLRKKIEEQQEISCDAECKKYGVIPLDLASAIYKSAKSIQKSLPVSYFTHHKTSKRIKLLLEPSNQKKTNLWLGALALGCATLLILLGRFWMF